jgi:hypothetical protein
MNGEIEVFKNQINHKFDKLYEVSGVSNFGNDLRPLLEKVIKEIYYSHGDLVFQIRLNHIDRAIFKFRQASQKTRINNSLKYFKACLVSAVKENALDELSFFNEEN